MLNEKERVQIIKYVDHTELNPAAGTADILKTVREGIKWGARAVCIPASFTPEAVAESAGRIDIAVVTGFPNGYDSTAAKLKETEYAIENGAAETDTVINIGRFIGGEYDYCLKELSALKKLSGNKILKVIVECCYLNEAQKIDVCKLVTDSGADFIKTSTGFGKGGALAEDVKLFAKHVGAGVRIKAAGGIRDFETAAAMIAAGASRIGASRLISILEADNP